MVGWAHVCFGGIKALGSAAQGAFETQLGPHALGTHATRVRLSKALVYAQNLKQYIHECADECHLHISWIHVSKCLAKALSYDARLLPPETYNGVAGVLDNAVKEVMDILLGCEIPSLKWNLLQLPGPLGGCGGRLASSESLAAFTATWLNTNRKVFAICSSLERPTSRAVVENEMNLARRSLVRRRYREECAR